MDDDRPEAQWSGDPQIAEEARRWQAEQHRQAEQYRQALASRAPTTEPRSLPVIAVNVWLGVAIGLGGPFFGVMTLMGGTEYVIPITVGSCGVAGLLFAVSVRGIVGALGVLLIPLFFAVLAAWATLSAESEPSRDDLILTGGFLLLVAAGTEAGYLVGRLIARLIRALRSPARAE